MWFKVAKQGAGDAAFDREVKGLIRRSQFFTKLFKHFGVDPRDLWRVQFHVAELQGVTAERDGNDIVINSGLLRQPLEDTMHVVAHQLAGWTADRGSKPRYAEESDDSPAWGIAHEMHRGRDMESIVAMFERDVQPALLVKMISKARRLLS